MEIVLMRVICSSRLQSSRSDFGFLLTYTTPSFSSPFENKSRVISLAESGTSNLECLIDKQSLSDTSFRGILSLRFLRTYCWIKNHRWHPCFVFECLNHHLSYTKAFAKWKSYWQYNSAPKRLGLQPFSMSRGFLMCSPQRAGAAGNARIRSTLLCFV